MIIKDFKYYSEQNKVFWVVNRDINERIKANDIVPCIYVEENEKGRFILQFEEDIKYDGFKYTAWRGLLGKIKGVHVNVLLIDNWELITLDNETVEFGELGRSDIHVDERFLAKFDLQ